MGHLIAQKNIKHKIFDILVKHFVCAHVTHLSALSGRAPLFLSFIYRNS